MSSAGQVGFGGAGLNRPPQLLRNGRAASSESQMPRPRFILNAADAAPLLPVYSKQPPPTGWHLRGRQIKFVRRMIGGARSMRLFSRSWGAFFRLSENGFSLGDVPAPRVEGWIRGGGLILTSLSRPRCIKCTFTFHLCAEQSGLGAPYIVCPCLTRAPSDFEGFGALGDNFCITISNLLVWRENEKNHSCVCSYKSFKWSEDVWKVKN